MTNRTPGNAVQTVVKLAALLLLAFVCLGSIHGQPLFPPPGRLADLGGHRLHLWCTGKGSPTVVVENGLGDFSSDWILVRKMVERFTRICTYDRAGYAWSDPGPKPRTYAQLNLELHDALAKLGERGPYILVGHSFGGGVVRNFAAVYPADVAGMVLVDIVQEDQRIPMGPKAARVRDSATGRAIPIPREILLPSDKPAPAAPKPVAKIQPPYDSLPIREQRMHAWAESLPALDDAEDSQKDWSAESMALFHSTPQDAILGDMPLVVLTRKEGGYSNRLDVPASELESDRRRLQAQLTRLSRKGKQTIVPSGHNMHLEDPAAVTIAIRDVFDRAHRKKK